MSAHRVWVCGSCSTTNKSRASVCENPQCRRLPHQLEAFHQSVLLGNTQDFEKCLEAVLQLQNSLQPPVPLIDRPIEDNTPPLALCVLRAASQTQYLRFMSLLVRAGADPFFVMMQRGKRVTPLSLAIEQRRVALLDVLAAPFLDPKPANFFYFFAKPVYVMVDKTSQYPLAILEYAFRTQSNACAKYLLLRGAPRPSTLPYYNLEMLDFLDDCPLRLGASGLLLLARKFEPRSLFAEHFLPLDVLKLIFKFSGLIP